MTDVQKIQLQRWWQEELRALTRKVMAQEEKRQQKAKTKAEAALADYCSRDDIIDAYGMDMITKKQKDKLLDLWDQVNDGGDDMYRAKIDMLQEFYTDSIQIMRDLGQEV